jgi:hypothetical protein
MKTKQTIWSTMTLLLAFACSGLVSAVFTDVAMADPATTSVTCVDGKEKTAKKDSKPDKSILDKKDFEYACRNNGGYKQPDGGSGGGGGSAGSLGTGNDCGGAETAIIKCDGYDNKGGVEKNGIWALLLLVINVMTAGVGVLAIAGIVYGSILYTTAEDKADQVKKATDIITNVVIGLVAFALMWAGLNFIIPGGVFS